MREKHSQDTENNKESNKDKQKSKQTNQEGGKKGVSVDQQVRINAQYIKDLSFENPGAPASLTLQDKPTLSINLNVEAKKLQDNVYESSMKISVKAVLNDKTIFVVELEYAGVFTLTNIAEEEAQQVLFIYCPNILFPFARHIIAKTTQDGGFMPLMLDPIDFARLFFEKQKKKNAA